MHWRIGRYGRPEHEITDIFIMHVICRRFMSACDYIIIYIYNTKSRVFYGLAPTTMTSSNLEASHNLLQAFIRDIFRTVLQ